MKNSIINTGLNGELTKSPETSSQTLDMKVVLSTLEKRRDAPLWESLTSEPQTQQSIASHLKHGTHEWEGSLHGTTLTFTGTSTIYFHIF